MLDSRSGRLICRREICDTHWMGGWVVL